MGMKAARKVADRKILTSAECASSPGGIRRSDVFLTPLSLFGLGLLVCSVSEEYLLSWNMCRSEMVLYSQKLRS